MKCLSYSNGTLKLLCSSADDTYEAGKRLGQYSAPGLLILLYGTLGAGKTRFVQGFGAALGFKNVKSPSFIIMNEYDGRLPMLHADLYRLGDGPDDVTAEITEYLENGFTALVEWAERWNEPEAENLIKIEIAKPEGSDGGRIVTLKASGPAAGASLKNTAVSICGDAGNEDGHRC